MYSLIKENIGRREFIHGMHIVLGVETGSTVINIQKLLFGQ